MPDTLSALRFLPAAALVALLGVGPTDAAADAKPKHETFVKNPKPLGAAVNKGLKFLADNQRADGGWDAGPGANVGGKNKARAGESDVGCTSIAVMAFLRAGNTPDAGEYKAAVKKGVKFVCDKVSTANKDDLFVTDQRGTQLQGKIGSYADTFLSALMLAELKGRAGSDEEEVSASLNKVIAKIARNQKEDGTFPPPGGAAGGGWAPVLSTAVCNKALSKAKLAGAKIDNRVLARAAKQTADAAKNAAGKGGKRGAGAGDAGIALYSLSQRAATFQDVVNAVNGTKPAAVAAEPKPAPVPPGDPAPPGEPADPIDRARVANYPDVETARKILADPDASTEQKFYAERALEEHAKANGAKPVRNKPAGPEVADVPFPANLPRELAREAKDARKELVAKIRDVNFVRGFGNDGGEEYLSFLNISEALVVSADADWKFWDNAMQQNLPKAQNGDGSWSGKHCISGSTFCTAAAVLVLLADRTPVSGT